MNCERWSKNFDDTLPDSVSSKEVEFEKILLVNIDGLNILVDKSIKGNQKLELRVPIKLFVVSEISYFNKSLRKKILSMTIFAISVIKEK